MKIFTFVFVFFSLSIYCYSQELVKTGLASYYGKQFHGRRTANGERYDMHSKTSAHRTLPFNSLVKVTNIKNGKSTMVRINDRGPMKKSRIIDLSYFAAKEIGLVKDGVAKVQIELVELGDTERQDLNLTECCYSDIENLLPLYSFSYNGKRPATDGPSIPESVDSLFSKDFVELSLSKVKISGVSNYPVTSNRYISESKSKKRNRNYAD